METISSTLTTSYTIDGTWINNEKDTKSATKIIISNRGKNVQVLKRGHSKNCDWGTKILTPETNSINMYWAIFDNSIAKSTFIFTINNNKMEVRYEQDYKSPSKEAKRFVENFTKLDLPVYEPIVASTPVEVMASTAIELEDQLKHNDDRPILLSDDSESNHDFKHLYYDLPSTYHLRHNDNQNHNSQKWILKVSIYIGAILNRVRNTVSIRRLISLTDMTT